MTVEQEILGLRLDQALKALERAGVEGVRVTETRPPSGGITEGRGALRVVRAAEGGRRLTVARFPDQWTDAGENA